MSHKLVQKVRRFLVSEDGPTIPEYAVLLALICAMIIASATYLGSESNAAYEHVRDGLDGALNN